MHRHLEYLFDLERKGIKLGLNPTRELLQRCGNPHEMMPIAQIAGTNGKGSTAAITAHILQQHGRTVGLFTSPHLCRFNERIRINGHVIEDDYIITWVDKHRRDLDEISSTFFEANTVLALSYFRDQEVDIAVLETGLGGRLDATTATHPEWTALTPIDFDHMDLLGETITAIAREKAGILKPGIPCFSAPQVPEVQEVINEEAASIGAPLTIVDRNHSNPQPLRLPGRHQRMNANLAWALSAAVLDCDFHANIARRAVKTAFWPGRYQKLSDNPRVIFDVAHNPHGISAFLDTMAGERIAGRKHLILALQKGKKNDHILQMLQPCFQKIVLTQTDTRHFLPATDLAIYADSDHCDTSTIPDAHNAIRTTLQNAAGEDFVAIIGTHYLGPAVAAVFKISFDILS